MKFYNKKLIAVTLCLLFGCSFSAQAKKPLSPAIDILKEKLEIKKCTDNTTTISFSLKDLESELGSSVSDFVTISSLPDSSVGVLTISGTKVLENQTVSKNSIGLLRFEPAKGAQGQTAFTFTNGGLQEQDFEIKCTLNVLSSLNLAPTAVDSSIQTAKNISICSNLKATDPEDDNLSYEIVKYPKKGTLKILNEQTGSFVYTPTDGKKGKDSFTFMVSDQYGNKSCVATVSAFIENKKYKTEFDDMDNHWAELAAARMCESGLMTTTSFDGKNIFNPDGSVSRGDFLAMAMIVTGNEKNVNLCYTTTFADDSLIPSNIKSYAETALAMGIIDGYAGLGSDGSVCFASETPITANEAAVIVQRLIKAPSPLINPQVNDIDTVPVWARDSIYSLVFNGIISGDQNGNVSSSAQLTRARAAQMLCNAMDYTAKASQKPKRSLFNLFGLLD